MNRLRTFFDGPLLTHGFIDSEKLKRAQRRKTLYTSDLIREMMDIPAVHAVRHIRISTGAKWEDWSLELDSQRSPRINLAQSNIQLERKHVVANVDVATVKTRYTQQLRHTAVLQATAAKENDITPPVGKNRDVGNYYSIQHQFPEAYGIGTMGLPQSASPERQAQAKQLKAYLLFYDQLLANYFSQLAHAKDLFSFYKQNRFSYFAQSIDDAKIRVGRHSRIRASSFGTAATNCRKSIHSQRIDLPKYNSKLQSAKPFLKSSIGAFCGTVYRLFPFALWGLEFRRDDNGRKIGG